MRCESCPASYWGFDDDGCYHDCTIYQEIINDLGCRLKKKTVEKKIKECEEAEKDTDIYQEGQEKKNELLRNKFKIDWTEADNIIRELEYIDIEYRRRINARQKKRS